jgi:hypothetical protein
MGKLEDRDPNAPSDVISGIVPSIDELLGDRAEVIIIGQITGIQAFLSNNHGTIYTENTIRVEQVIDQTVYMSGPAKPGATITLLQNGGALQLPNGRVLKVLYNAGNELQLHGRYAFFLVYLPGVDAYGCPKAWQLTGGKAVAVSSQDLTRVATRKSAYNGMGEGEFISHLEKVKASWDHAHPH